MQGTGSLHATRLPSGGGYALLEIVIGLAVKGASRLGGILERAMESHRIARARRDLQALSDHHLRDIGLTREDVERLFR